MNPLMHYLVFYGGLGMFATQELFWAKRATAALIARRLPYQDIRAALHDATAQSRDYDVPPASLHGSAEYWAHQHITHAATEGTRRFIRPLRDHPIGWVFLFGYSMTLTTTVFVLYPLFSLNIAMSVPIMGFFAACVLNLIAVALIVCDYRVTTSSSLPKEIVHIITYPAAFIAAGLSDFVGMGIVTLFPLPGPSIPSAYYAAISLPLLLLVAQKPWFYRVGWPATTGKTAAASEDAWRHQMLRILVHCCGVDPSQAQANVNQYSHEAHRFRQPLQDLWGTPEQAAARYELTMPAHRMHQPTFTAPTLPQAAPDAPPAPPAPQPTTNAPDAPPPSALLPAPDQPPPIAPADRPFPAAHQAHQVHQVDHAHQAHTSALASTHNTSQPTPIPTPSPQPILDAQQFFAGPGSDSDADARDVDNAYKVIQDFEITTLRHHQRLRTWPLLALTHLRRVLLLWSLGWLCVGPWTLDRLDSPLPPQSLFTLLAAVGLVTGAHLAVNAISLFVPYAVREMAAICISGVVVALLGVCWWGYSFLGRPLENQHLSAWMPLVLWGVLFTLHRTQPKTTAPYVWADPNIPPNLWRRRLRELMFFQWGYRYEHITEALSVATRKTAGGDYGSVLGGPAQFFEQVESSNFSFKVAPPQRRYASSTDAHLVPWAVAARYAGCAVFLGVATFCAHVGVWQWVLAAGIIAVLLWHVWQAFFPARWLNLLTLVVNTKLLD